MTSASEPGVEAASSAPTKRNQILDAATRVFLQHGFEGTSMDRVAAESGAARGLSTTNLTARKHYSKR